MNHLKKYIAIRVGQAVPLVLAVICVNFAIMHIAPGDPVDFLVSGMESASPEYVKILKTKYGFDKPLIEQLLIYLLNIVRGEFGYSFYYHDSVLSVIMSRLSATLLLTLASLLIELLGIYLGVLASKKPYSFTDNAVTVLTLVTFNMPYFWLGMILILFFGLYLGVFPIAGMSTIGATGLDYYISVLWHLSLPAATLGLGRLALYTRYTRASMLEVLREDYITTAWAKGCSERMVYYKHALRNALIPIVTIVMLRMPMLFTGATLVETVFGWPGLGRLFYEAIFRRDFNLLMAEFIIVSILTISFNLLADICYAYLDPKVRYK